MKCNDLAAILSLIKEREALGFEQLYHGYFRFIFGTAYSILKNEENSYDVVQNVMSRLYTMDKTLFPSNHEMSWLYTVVKNETLMYMRKQETTVSLDDLPDLSIQDEQIEKYIEWQAFLSLIQNLNDRQKEVVTLKILGGLTHREISRILSIPIGTVQWVYNTSIKSLRIALSSLSTLVLIAGGNFIYQFFKSKNNSIPVGIGINSIPGETQILTTPVIVSLVILLLLVVLTASLFYFSDRFPTKHLK